MVGRVETVADLGELRLLNEVILPDVAANVDAINDDCAHLSLFGKSALWSMDPCPTPVANWFGKASPEVWGCYTAAINLSDIAASGGTPVGMLVSLEIPDETPVSFVKGFQSGLMRALRRAGADLLGGNVKSAKKFSATGTIIGISGGRAVTRKIEANTVSVYLVGGSGEFWAAVLANYYGSNGLCDETLGSIDRALCFPLPRVREGILLGGLPFSVACMDCSDGPVNSVFQLARINSLDIELYSHVDWSLSTELMDFFSLNNVDVENACYSFGDWQLACLVATEYEELFKASLSGSVLTKLGEGVRGAGRVTTEDGRSLQVDMINQNFQGGYNSIGSAEELIDRYLRKPLFR